MNLKTTLGLALGLLLAATPVLAFVNYGKHCGTGRESGEPIPNNKAKDRLDAACKFHDACTLCGEYMRGDSTKARVKLRVPKLKKKKGKLKLKWARKDKLETVVKPAEECQRILRDRMKRFSKRYCTPSNKRFSMGKCQVAWTGLAYADDVKGFKADARTQQCINVVKQAFPKGEWKSKGTLVCDGGDCRIVDRAP